MKRFLFTAALLAVMAVMSADTVFTGANTSGSGDTASLKETHQRYLKAWSDRDLDTIVDIGTGAAGFGHSTAFPRPVRIREPFRKQVAAFYDMMDVFSITIMTENYRVVGDTGLAWGHYDCTTKQKDGPQRTLHLRYAHTFTRVDGEWKLVMYHRSFMPSEDMQ